MKKLIALFTIAVSTATMAATPIDRGVVTDTYKTVIKQIPYRVEVCQDRVQPAGDGSATNELVGALFGGAIGNQFGNGDGKDVSHKTDGSTVLESMKINRARVGKKRKKA